MLKDIKMEEIELFNEKILLKNYSCLKDENIEVKPRLKLTIKVTDSCNCSCLFCSNSNMKDFGKLEFNKLEEVIRKLQETGMLYRISITGGEPMLFPNEVNRIINLIHSIDEKIEIGITTNGMNLREFVEFDNVQNIEGIHISRHHYDDQINQSIFKNNSIAKSEDIKYLQSNLEDKLIVNINTVLMKGYIDDLKKLKMMCEYVNSLGVKRIGAISLLKLNDYAREHFIDFNDIFKEKDSSFLIGRHLYNHNLCECIDGIYSTEDSNIIEFYSRVVSEEKCPYVTQLVYTTDNKLKTGFNGKVIY